MQSFLQYRRLRPFVPSTPSLNSSSEKNSGSQEANSPQFEEDVRSHEVKIPQYEENACIPVDWDGPSDPSCPRNWSLRYKIWVCALVSINVFALDWCSAADSQASKQMAQEFGVSRRVENVGSALFVFGIAGGALFAGPITETLGRNPVYIGGRVLHFFFILGTALAHHIGMQLLCRLLAGLGASAVLAIHGASIADVFGQEGRSLAWPFVALWSFLGTTLSPVAGAWIVQSTKLSWRWADWIAVIMSGTTLILTIACLPETFTPVILKWKAIKLRRATGDNKYMASIETQKSFKELLKANLYRAVIMTTREYIVIFLGLWLVVVYIVVFGFLSGMDFLFAKTHAFSSGMVGTSFVAIAFGVIINTGLSTFYARQYKKRSERWVREKGASTQLPPEYRMIPSFPVAFGLPVSLFWLGWTNYPNISPWSGLGAIALFGFSWAGIYVCVFHYIFDTYSIYAGSALASITFVRYMFAGSIQIVSIDMWETLGTQWTCTLLGGIASLLVPIPFILWVWGERIRKISKFAGQKALENSQEPANTTTV
ncbi:unnamed protein product [Blumeria hordei]|uniref:Major facilitator superfamily (MFS) profile domain-containing protein n=1 Tax=Blumeria hordei TaxID=2867405 RepID=A0A383UH72_BLUHO|nr:unnamed protein product [Blumeria hordei]